ncbi:MAG TPA: hypothetical protein VGR30_02060 [Candidatus Binatia bacterium]|nr:hypothetical protein [Candidatus Binatia bacterium]
MNADQSVNLNESLDRRFACHKSKGAAGLRVDGRSVEEREVGRSPMATWTSEELRKIAAAEEVIGPLEGLN